VWPIQLMPLRPGQQVQRHWRALESIGTDNGWSEVVDEFLRLEGEVDCRVSELEGAALKKAAPARGKGDVSSRRGAATP
jgi:hypothetical protein